MSDPLTCARCSEEVRYGSRDGGLTSLWLHREAADHHAVLGTPWSPEYVAEIERQMDLPRTRVVVKRKKHKKTKDVPDFVAEWCEVETYTTRELDVERYMKNAKYAAAAEADEAAAAEPDEDEELEGEVEPIEVYSTPCPLSGVLEVETPSGKRLVAVPGGARTLISACEKNGWDVVDFAYSRGPWMGAKGGSLGIADVHRLVVRGSVVDGPARVGVVWWRNGKAQSAWLIEDKTNTRGGAKALLTWIKENPRGEEQ